MARELRLLFVPEYDWALDYDLDPGQLIIFPKVPEISIGQYPLTTKISLISEMLFISLSFTK